MSDGHMKPCAYQHGQSPKVGRYYVESLEFGV